MKYKYKVSAMKDINILYNTIHLNNEECLDFSLDLVNIVYNYFSYAQLPIS